MIVYHGNNGFISTMKRVSATHPERLGSFNYLISFAHIRAAKMKDIHDPEMQAFLPNIFIDSGAFSAWNGGSAIDIEQYLDFLRGVAGEITVAASLDAIGDPVGSWKNWIYMREQGVDTMPAYHIGEPIDWLHKMVDAGATYIGLGGIAGEHRKVRHRFLDHVFQQYPTKIQFHGFGITDEGIMEEYPWYSVDSTASMHHCIRGTIYTPWGIFRPEDLPPIGVEWVQSIGRDVTVAQETGYMGVHERFMINVTYFEGVGKRPKKKTASRNFLF